MRRLTSVGLCLTLVLASAAPALAQSPDILRSGPGRAQIGGAGGGRGGGGGPAMQGNRGGGQRFDGGQQGQRFGGGQQGQRFGGGQRFDGNGYRRRGYDRGIGAGIAGLAAGAVIGGALASRSTYGYGYGDDYGYVDQGPSYAYEQPEAVYADPSGGDAAYCAQRYRSYDPSSGTYLGLDGYRHPCP